MGKRKRRSRRLRKIADPDKEFPVGSEIVNQLKWAGYDPRRYGDIVVCKPVNVTDPKYCFLLDTDEYYLDQVRAFLRETDG